MSEDEEILKELLRENEGPRVIAAFMIEKDFSITVLITNAELKKSCTAQKRNEIAMEMKAIILPHHPTTIIHNTYNFYGSMPKEKNVAEIETKKPTPLLSSTKQLVVEEKPESESKSNYALDDNDDDYYQ